MEDRSSIHPYTHHQHLHRPSLQVTIPNHPSPGLGYFSSQPPLDPLEQYGSRPVESSGSVSTPNIFPGVSGESSADSGGGYVSVSGNGLEGDASVGSHFDGDSRFKSHFDSWYGGYNKEESWDDGESRKSPVEDFYKTGERCGNKNDLHYFCASEDGQDDINDFATVKVEADYDGYDDFSCKVKDKSVYSREANISHYSKHRGSSCPFSDAKSTESYLGGEEEFGPGRSYGDDPSLQAELKPGSWLTPSPPSQALEPGGDRWRVGVDSQTPAASAVMSQPHTQKLDSFSEAFLSQRKRGFPLIGNAMGHMWRFWSGKGDGPGLIQSSHASCVFDTLPDSCHPPSSSPALPSLSSPPPTSHHMPSVLSPPPTPLPPLSLSPTKVDSFGGVGHHSALKGLDPLGMLQFFPPHVQSLPSVHPSGMIWKLPLQSHCLPHQTGDSKSIVEGHLRSSHFSEYGNPTANHNSPQTPAAPLVTSSSSPSSIRPSLDAFQSLSHLSSPRYEAGKRLTPYMVSHRVQNGSLTQSHPTNATPLIYTGTPFPSVLHSSRGFRKAHYIPRPILNPKRRGTGLYASLSSFRVKEEQTASSGEEGQGCEFLPCINVGPDFQADLPPCVLKWEASRAWSPSEEAPREQLLWKPWEQLERGDNSQLQVESLLSMCSSSCLPGGGSNMELALHCLHYCQGDTMATLEMLLFSQPAPTEDYHYSGSDLWTDSEKDLFNTALVCYGKDFSLIQNTVRTKSVQQCVEFYFLHKKLLDKQRKRKEEEERNGEGMELQARVAPFPQPMNNQLGLDGAVAAPLLASFFPCKLCGKMFYKIKSRNAHMKIHRQPQEDWSERRLQHQLLTQRLALMSQNFPPNLGSGLLQPQASVSAYTTSALTSDGNRSNSCTRNIQSSHSETTSNSVSHGNTVIGNDHTMVTYNAANNPNAHVMSPSDGSDSNQDTTPAVSFHQSWELAWKQP